MVGHRLQHGEVLLEVSHVGITSPTCVSRGNHYRWTAPRVVIGATVLTFHHASTFEVSHERLFSGNCFWPLPLPCWPPHRADRGRRTRSRPRRKSTSSSSSWAARSSVSARQRARRWKPLASRPWTLSARQAQRTKTSRYADGAS